jgi:hypothetical protein
MKFSVFSFQPLKNRIGMNLHLLKTQNSRLKTGPRGFTLLLAALVSSVVLALGISIFEIALKQVTLSSMGRDSQFAFYAADTGAECALYWDVRHNYFGTTTPSSSAVCATQTLTVSGRPIPDESRYELTFQFEPTGKCAAVTVTKCVAECNAAYPGIHTIIHADGFNTTCDSVSSNPRALQRSVELHY